MAKRRSAELDREIREALSRISRKPGLKTRSELDAEIDTILAGGLPAERYEIARALGFAYPKKVPSKPKSLTDTNLFVLVEKIVAHGPTFPGRVEAVDAPHLKRALILGFIEPAGGGAVRLTPGGREVVADAIVAKISRSTDRDKINLLERALAKLS